MRRREFIMLLGGTAAAWPLVVRAQQPPLPVVGILSTVAPSVFANRLRAFRQGLKERRLCRGPERRGRISLDRR